MGKFLFALILCCISGIVLATPNSGKNNEVIEWDWSWTVDCDGPELSAELSGWSKFREFGGVRNRNISLEVFHLDTVYTNDSGDSWVWRDRGPDHYYVVVNEDGEPEVHWAITGRSGWNVIGHVVINTVTGDLIVSAGQHPFGGDDSDFMDFWADDLACEILY